MTLSSGIHLGPYTVVEPLGVGGMGEVYRARDPRLGRDVAIKVIPAALTGDPERRARFEREARLLAALNHPGIATVHGIEHVDRSIALVMELVEGETLQQRIARGALPLDEALAIARPLAEALEFAHERGIVHRDLKPANVKVRDDGAVKVLDFGLAKALEGEAAAQADADLSRSPTLTRGLSGTDVILGTAAYMAPEQARGRGADRRADVWAFGVVLFEMLTGRQLFVGETLSETLAAVIKDEVPWMRLPAGTPPGVRRLLERCLERDPRLRLQAMGEARIALTPGAPGLERTPAIAGSRRWGTRPGWIAATAGALALAALGFLAGRWSSASRPAVELRRYPLAVDEAGEAYSAEYTISPDGRYLVYGRADTLYVRDLVTMNVRPLHVGVSPDLRPFWSPDSRRVAFSDGVRLFRVGLEGGDVAPIAALPTSPSGGAGGTWREDDRLFLAFGSGGLYEADLAGGGLREVLPVDSTSSDFHEPLAIPGTTGIVFIRHRHQGEANEMAVFDGRRWRDIFTSGAAIGRPVWSPSGHILFQQRVPTAGIWALPFSSRTLAATGPAFLVAAGATSPTVSRAGALLYSAGGGEDRWHLTWVTRNGTETRLPGPEVGSVRGVSLSPDGSRVIVSMFEAMRNDLWLIDCATGARSQLTFDGVSKYDPSWSVDQTTVFYQHGSNSIRAVAVAGGSPPRHLMRGGFPHQSPDGRRMCITVDRDLWLLASPDDTVGTPLVHGPEEELRGVFSPDGERLAYMVTGAGGVKVFVTTLSAPAKRWLVSAQGGRRPLWSADGRRLLYQSADGTRLLETDIASGETPTPGQTREVLDFEAHRYRHWGTRTWDIHPDGRLLVLAATSSGSGAARTVLVENWFQEFAGARNR